jgi:hypothetical protein
VKEFKNSLELLRKLQPKTYMYKIEEFKNSMNLPQGIQVGIMAQDLQKVLPNLVKEKIAPAYIDPETNKKMGEDTKFLGVDYVGLIPVLVQAVKELDAKLETTQKENADLKQQLNDICSYGCASFKSETSNPIINSDKENRLMQNAPNPFSTQTTISYILNTGNTAFLNITSLDGKVVKHIDLTGKGKASVMINANELTSGTYTYSLYVDGNVMDTKLMVITK